MRFLLLLFILVPAIEVTLLAQIIGWIGGMNTLLLIVLTGILGAALAKRAGVGVLRQMRADMAAGRMPAGPMVDGAIILVAGAFLVTPGVLTDLTGFLLLLPGFRNLVKGAIRRRFEHAVASGRIQVVEPLPQSGPVIDVTPDRHGRDDGAT